MQYQKSILQAEKINLQQMGAPEFIPMVEWLELLISN
jgi:hypothetical protein